MYSITQQALLIKAETLIRTRGYPAFSLTDLAASVAVAEAEIIECFSTKEDLCMQLLGLHINRVKMELHEIRREFHDAESRLVAYACLFSEGHSKGILPLSSALAAVQSDVPRTIRKEIVRLFRFRLNWIRKVLQEHCNTHGQFAAIETDRAAHLLFRALEGDAMIDCAMGANEPSASGFLQVLVTLGISAE